MELRLWNVHEKNGSLEEGSTLIFRNWGYPILLQKSIRVLIHLRCIVMKCMKKTVHLFFAYCIPPFLSMIRAYTAIRSMGKKKSKILLVRLKRDTP